MSMLERGREKERAREGEDGETERERERERGIWRQRDRYKDSAIGFAILVLLVCCSFIIPCGRLQSKERQSKRYITSLWHVVVRSAMSKHETLPGSWINHVCVIWRKVSLVCSIISFWGGVILGSKFSFVFSSW